MGKVISFLNPKGGVGKSTCALNIAIDFWRRGENVLAIDANPTQKSLHRYLSKIEHHPTVVILETPSRLDKNISLLKENYDFIFLDGATSVVLDEQSREDKMLVSSVYASDLIVTPLQPSGLDMDGLGILSSLVKMRQSVDSQKPAWVFLINADMPHTYLSRGIESRLKLYGFPILKQRLRRSIHYVEAMMRGVPVFDTNTVMAKKLAQEVHNVSLELMGHLHEEK